MAKTTIFRLLLSKNENSKSKILKSLNNNNNLFALQGAICAPGDFHNIIQDMVIKQSTQNANDMNEIYDYEIRIFS